MAGKKDTKWIVTPGLFKTVEEFRILCEIACKKKQHIIICGPTGVGKSLFLEIFKQHYKNTYPKTPVHEVNCAHFEGDLARSELFGHTKGAFTGAINNKTGLLKLADKGLLVLEEIGTLSTPTQAKLLTVIETQSFFEVGGTEEKKTNVQIVAATNNEDKLREDFFNRFIPFYVPPICERRQDILYYIATICSELIDSLRPWEVLTLMCYHWPGGVREIEKVAQLLIQSRIWWDKEISSSPDLGKEAEELINMARTTDDEQTEYRNKSRRYAKMVDQNLKRLVGYGLKAGRLSSVTTHFSPLGEMKCLALSGDLTVKGVDMAKLERMLNHLHVGFSVTTTVSAFVGTDPLDFSNDEFRESDLPDFLPGEFTRQLSVKKLCRAIEKVVLGLPLRSPRRTIEWLNEMLQIPSLHNTILSGADTDILQRAKDLVLATKGLGSKDYHKLGIDEQIVVRQINRLLIETRFQNVTPKRGGRPTISQFCKAIKDATSGIAFHSTNNTIGRLNELLRVSDLYDRIKGKGHDVKLCGDTKGLISKTDQVRGISHFLILDHGEQELIKELNRLILETLALNGDCLPRMKKAGIIKRKMELHDISMMEEYEPFTEAFNGFKVFCSVFCQNENGAYDLLDLTKLIYSDQLEIPKKIQGMLNTMGLQEIYWDIFKFLTDIDMKKPFEESKKLTALEVKKIREAFSLRKSTKEQSLSGGGLETEHPDPMVTTFEEWQRHYQLYYCTELLKRTGSNKSRAATIADMKYSTFLDLLRRLNIPEESDSTKPIT